MRTPTLLTASLLALALPVGTQTASARSIGGYQSGVSVTAAPPLVDTGSTLIPAHPPVPT
jgi:hypothetical protein